MPNLKREDLEARYMMFQEFALKDQRGYYAATIKKHRKASHQVNQLRAIIALLTGVAAASVGLIAAMSFNVCPVPLSVPLPVPLPVPTPGFSDLLPAATCEWWQLAINVLIILATGLPAFAAFFNMLADLYQWDKLIAIYDAAQENIEVADAHSPIEDMTLEEYRASFQAYGQGTLDVMSDETAQWGQSIRTPKGMEEYLDEAKERATSVGGDADSHRLGFAVSHDVHDTTPADDDTDDLEPDDPS